VPDTLISLKFAKKHAETAEVKDRVVRELIDELTIYYAANSKMIGFPEMIVPLGVVLRKFKKYTHNGNYRKIFKFQHCLQNPIKKVTTQKS
jgi:hypothetical protein